MAAELGLNWYHIQDMLRISKLADYAVVIVSVMTEKPQQSLSATTIMEKTGVQLPTVRKILKQLTTHHILEGTRGSEGGYSLIACHDELSVADVVEAIDGPIALTECGVSEGYQCAVQDCRTQKGWNSVSQVVRETLANIKVKEFNR